MVNERITVTPVAKLYGSPAEISQIYGLSVAYLKKLRHIGQGPRYRKLGRLVLYSLADVSAWFDSESQLVTPESC